MVFRAIFDKFKAGLAKTRSLFSGIASLFRLRGRVDKDFELERLERSGALQNKIDGLKSKLTDAVTRRGTSPGAAAPSALIVAACGTASS